MDIAGQFPPSPLFSVTIRIRDFNLSAATLSGNSFGTIHLRNIPPIIPLLKRFEIVHNSRARAKTCCRRRGITAVAIHALFACHPRINTFASFEAICFSWSVWAKYLCQRQRVCRVNKIKPFTI